MANPIVICDHGFVEASLVPANCLVSPGRCPFGVYDTLLWENCALYDYPDHLARFQGGCSYLGINTDCVSKAFSSANLLELVERNGLALERARLRLMAFTAPHGDAERPAHVSYIGAAWAAASAAEKEGIRCMVSVNHRQSTDKSYQYKLLGRWYVDEDLAAAGKRGLQDVIYFNTNGQACEAAYSNLWVMKNSRLLTPPIDSPCLPGIVRAKMLSRADILGIEVDSHSAVTKSDLAGADRVFLTSSIRRVQMVDEIEGVWRRASVLNPGSGADEGLLAQLLDKL